MSDENRLKWTNEDWARFLGCSGPLVVKYRKMVNDNFYAYVGRHIDTKKYDFAIERRHDTPSGSPRFIPMLTTSRHFDTEHECRNWVQKTLIPSLELNDFYASLYKMPARALQLVKVR